MDQDNGHGRLVMLWANSLKDWQYKHRTAPTATTLHMVRMCSAKLSWAWQKLWDAKYARRS